MTAVQRIEREIREQAGKDGYLLNPDREILEGIIEGLAANEERLGYWNCPCRPATGSRSADFDIICPCRYRDPDLAEYGRCYCALYATEEYVQKGLPPDPIPERRLPVNSVGKMEERSMEEIEIKPDAKPIKTWRCQVCGYLCARPEAPPICPICRAKQDKFEEYKL